MPDTKGRVKTIIMDKAQDTEVNDAVQLNHLGIAPHIKSELVLALNSEFQINITPEQAEQVNDVGEVWILVEQLMASG